jgi:hypothetical protein
MGNNFEIVEDNHNKQKEVCINDLTPEIANNSSKKCEILYDGHFYDVTQWIPRHPGGNVIKFYTEGGEDATLAIQQFHHRSLRQVQGIMKSFQKRIALPEERMELYFNSSHITPNIVKL